MALGRPFCRALGTRDGAGLLRARRPRRTRLRGRGAHPLREAPRGSCAPEHRRRGRRRTPHPGRRLTMGVFKMPSLGADMDSGTVIEWLVQPGSKVERGDIVAVVRTDKADVEVEVFETGVIGEMLVDEGVRVDVGTPLATVLTPASP